MIKKIDHINIVVEDLEAAKNFFCDLGFVVKKQSMLHGEWIDKIVQLPQVKAEYVVLMIPHTQTRLELITYYTPKGKRDPRTSMVNQIGFRHMAFEVKNIEEIFSRLKKKGVPFLSDIQIYDNKKKLCYFLGPESILLELAEYMD